MVPGFSPDPSQAKVLEHRGGALLVTGGAGSGKTAVLLERFARLIEGGADPERIALVVGSSRARSEGRRALLDRLRGSLPELRVLTFHSLAFRVLSDRYRQADRAEPPVVLSNADQFARVQELLAGQDPADWPAYGHLLGMRKFADEVRQFLFRAQESMRTPEDVERRAAAAGLTGWLELARFYREYQQVLQEMNLVDFAALQQRAATATAEGAALFDHVLVDDYQDATFAAEAILDGLGVPDLVIAGDEDAHLFSFQGTTVEPMRRFAERFRADVVELEGSHRAPEPVAIEAWCASHASEEHAAVARELRRLHVEEGVSWNDLAVVVRRQGAHLGGLLRALDDAGVPRIVPERGLSLSAEPATFPYVLALRWLVADAEGRDQLIEPVLTSDLVGLSPAAARGLMRAAQATAGRVGAALDIADAGASSEAAAAAAVRETFEKAEPIAHRSVVDAFRILWEELPYSATLVGAADSSVDARRELDMVVTFSKAVAEAGASKDPSTQAFLEGLVAGEQGPGYSVWEQTRSEAVRVLTAHGAVGQEFDTVVVAGAVEGNFPSLSRPEPMFDLEALDRPITRSERNRSRYEDERRLFRAVLGRARHRVVLAASDTHADDDELSVRSRFADELGLSWLPVPEGPFGEPVSVPEASAAWRRTLADPNEPPVRRLAAIEGLLALGSEPSRWWYQREWTDTGHPLHEAIRLSYSKLAKLENCELQHVLADELGLGRDAGYQAWVGKTVHTLIEDAEKGTVKKDLQTLLAAVDERWRPEVFPSRAVSEAFRSLAKDKMIPNWLAAYGEGTALAVEKDFEFELEGVTMKGVIDRIGALENGGTLITDFKTGRPDTAGKPEENLQLGIYYLAVQLCDDLTQYRPVRAVELAFLKGDYWHKDMPVPKAWPVSPSREEAYQTAVREKLAELIAHERELLSREVYRPNPYADCFWCDFKTLCPLYPEGAAPLERVGAAR